jgi:hypothetical protein
MGSSSAHLTSTIASPRCRRKWAALDGGGGGGRWPWGRVRREGAAGGRPCRPPRLPGRREAGVATRRQALGAQEVASLRRRGPLAAGAAWGPQRLEGAREVGWPPERKRLP